MPIAGGNALSLVGICWSSKPNAGEHSVKTTQNIERFAFAATYVRKFHPIQQTINIIDKHR